MSASASFEERLPELCEQIEACDTKQESVEFRRQLEKLMQARITYLREKTIHLVKN